MQMQLDLSVGTMIGLPKFILAENNRIRKNGMSKTKNFSMPSSLKPITFQSAGKSLWHTFTVVKFDKVRYNVGGNSDDRCQCVALGLRMLSNFEAEYR